MDFPSSVLGVLMRLWKGNTRVKLTLTMGEINETFWAIAF